MSDGNRFPETGTILVVDDVQAVRQVLRAILERKGFRVLESENGQKALELLESLEEPPDVILLDLLMPEMDGYEFLRRIQSHREWRLIPVIMLTAQGDAKLEALQLGASDFLQKPVESAELIARVRAHVRLHQYIRGLEDIENILYTLARIVEARDRYTEEHTERVATYALALADEVGLSEEERENLRKGSMVHDIGKIALPDSILLKPGPLTAEEFEKVKEHPVVGYRILMGAQSMRGALSVVRHHHERWDGQGYPDRLKGEEIPLLARLCAVADAFDAMTSDRPYRAGMPLERALNILRDGAGTQWDPDLIGFALKVFPELYHGTPSS